MAKAKAPPGVQNKPIYTRASYLYQAAAFLETASQQTPSHNAANGDIKDAHGRNNDTADATTQKNDEAKNPNQAQPAESRPKPPAAHTADQRRALQNMSRSLLADMRAVSLKVLIRQRPEMKRSVCRYCDTLLVVGGETGTCDAVVENASRGGRKPWADVLVLRCRTCGGVKRFPVGEPRKKQLRKGFREAKQDEVAAED